MAILKIARMGHPVLLRRCDPVPDPGAPEIRPLLLVADALGLALFAISGARIADAGGYGGIVAVILGTMTGVAGGVIRDILLAEIPLLLRDGEIYATAALLGIIVYLGLQALGLERTTAAYFGMAMIVVVRFTGIFLGLRMPALRLGDSKKPD